MSSRGAPDDISLRAQSGKANLPEDHLTLGSA